MDDMEDDESTPASSPYGAAPNRDTDPDAWMKWRNTIWAGRIGGIYSEFYQPFGVAVDKSGNIYWNDKVLPSRDELLSHVKVAAVQKPHRTLPALAWPQAAGWSPATSFARCPKEPTLTSSNTSFTIGTTSKA